MKLLIADDSTLSRQYLSMWITEFLGITDIEQTEDVLGAIAAIKIKKPDVVILDLRMPGGSALDVLKAVKSKDQRPVFIVFTNYVSRTLRRACMASGANFFFDKFFSQNELMVVLRELKVKNL